MSVQSLRDIASALKRQLAFYRRILNDPRTPHLPKILLWLALGYLALPFDLIPDGLPVIGHLDDAVIVPLLLLLAMRLTPSEVREAHRDTLDH